MDIIERILGEAESYRSMADLERLAEGEEGLGGLPIQPLYVALRELDPVDCAYYLGKLSVEQRQAFLDIDLWKKDELDIDSFHFWPQAYKAADPDIRSEFAKSGSFALFLKGKMNIWTFDVEDPRYPDHDNYFLTEDNLLLFEYEEDYPYVEEVKGFIKDIYADLGVEGAYTYLFKIVSDTYSHILEEEYRLKNDRLVNYGFVDYYNALDLLGPMSDVKFLDRDIAGKKTDVDYAEVPSSGHGLHRSALTVFRGRLGPLHKELAKVENKKRRDFLQFNFVRLVNGYSSWTVP